VTNLIPIEQSRKLAVYALVLELLSWLDVWKKMFFFYDSTLHFNVTLQKHIVN